MGPQTPHATTMTSLYQMMRAPKGKHAGGRKCQQTVSFKRKLRAKKLKARAHQRDARRAQRGR